MSNVMELSLRGASNLEKLMRAVLLDSENKVPADRLRIVGAIADGAIIESGSNANGYWCKLADGTLICWGNCDYTFTTNSYQEVILTLPAAALSGAVGSGCIHTYTKPGAPMIQVNFNLSGSSANFGLQSCDGTPGEYTRNLRWHVITRWKA